MDDQYLKNEKGTQCDVPAGLRVQLKGTKWHMTLKNVFFNYGKQLCENDCLKIIF